MPWKLLLTLLIFSLFIAFTGFNIENTSAISFGFIVLNDVPIFLSLSISFLAGAFYAIPYALLSRKKTNNKSTALEASKPRQETKKFSRKSKKTGNDGEGLTEGGTYLAEGDYTNSAPKV